MKPWAKWLINNHMRYVLFVLAFLSLPIYVIAALVMHFREVAGWFIGDLKAIARERKN